MLVNFYSVSVKMFPQKPLNKPEPNREIDSEIFVFIVSANTTPPVSNLHSDPVMAGCF